MRVARTITASLGLALIFAAASGQAPDRTLAPDVAGLPLRPGLLTTLRSLDLDVLAVWEGAVYVRADDAVRSRLSAAGLASFPPIGLFPSVPRGASEAAGGPNGAYHSYAELAAEMARLQAAHPSLARLTDIGRSLENRRLLALKISDRPEADEDEARILLVGCHHAREWISVEVPLLIAARLLESYDADPRIRALVDACEIWVVPLLNPDGLQYSIDTYRYWRKNRRDNGDGSWGVDLNRNYGLAWGIDETGSSGDPSSDVYRGAAAFSEPEARALRDFARSRRFEAAVSYHSFGQAILYPWAFTADPAPGTDGLDAAGRAMAALMEAVGGRAYAVGPSAVEMYPSNGDAMDWIFAETGAPAYTIELPPVDLLHGGFLNAEADIDGIFRENLPAALDLMERAAAAHRPAGELPAGTGRDAGKRGRAARIR